VDCVHLFGMLADLGSRDMVNHFVLHVLFVATCNDAGRNKSEDISD